LDRFPLLLGQAKRNAVVVRAEPVVFPLAFFGRCDIAEEVSTLPTARLALRGKGRKHGAKLRNPWIAVDRVHRAAWAGETQEQVNIVALSPIEREREVAFFNGWNRRLIEGILARGLGSERLLREAVVAARGQPPQSREEGAQCTVHGVSRGELLVLQQDQQIASRQKRVPLYCRIAEPLAGLGHCPANRL